MVKKYRLASLVEAPVTRVQPDNSHLSPREFIEVPVDKIKFLLGKGGCVKRSIENESGTKIHIGNDGETKIIGSPENIKMAKKSIKSILRKCKQKTILIPQYSMGYLTGSQEKAINTIKEITRAFVDTADELQGSQIRVILGGTEKQTRRAEELILRIVSLAEEKRKVRLEEAIESVESSNWATSPDTHDENSEIQKGKRRKKNKINLKLVSLAKEKRKREVKLEEVIESVVTSKEPTYPETHDENSKLNSEVKNEKRRKKNKGIVKWKGKS